MPKLLQRDTGLPSYGYFCTLVLAQVALPNADVAVRSLWDKLGWPDGEFTAFKSTNALPSAVGVDMGDTVWVGINGTDSLSQVLKYARPGSVMFTANKDPRDETKHAVADANDVKADTDWANYQFDKWGREVYRILIAKLGGRQPNLILCGHSYGGAVVTATAGFAAALGGFGRISLTTFGAPKVYGASINKRLNPVDVCRWMNVGDPIPALPPSEGEVGWPLSLTRKFGFQLLLPAYRQPKGGKLILKSGQILPATTTQITPGFVKLVEGSFSGHVEVAEATQHYLSTYQAQLHLAAHKLHEFTAVSDAGLVADGIPVRVDPVFSVRNPMLLPAVSPFVPSAFLPEVQALGAKWAVNWMGTTIMIDASKSRCHTVAKALKKFLRRTQVAEKMFSGSLIDAIGFYAGSSNTGGLGFRPDIGTWDPG